MPVLVEERDRLQPKLTCSAHRGGGGVPTVQQGERGWGLKAVLMLSLNPSQGSIIIFGSNYSIYICQCFGVLLPGRNKFGTASGNL